MPISRMRFQLSVAPIHKSTAQTCSPNSLARKMELMPLPQAQIKGPHAGLGGSSPEQATLATKGYGNPSCSEGSNRDHILRIAGIFHSSSCQEFDLLNPSYFPSGAVTLTIRPVLREFTGREIIFPFESPDIGLLVCKSVFLRDIQYIQICCQQAFHACRQPARTEIACQRHAEGKLEDPLQMSRWIRRMMRPGVSMSSSPLMLFSILSSNAVNRSYVFTNDITPIPNNPFYKPAYKTQS